MQQQEEGTAPSLLLLVRLHDAAGVCACAPAPALWVGGADPQQAVTVRVGGPAALLPLSAPSSAGGLWLWGDGGQQRRTPVLGGTEDGRWVRLVTGGDTVRVAVAVAVPGEEQGVCVCVCVCVCVAAVVGLVSVAVSCMWWWWWCWFLFYFALLLLVVLLEEDIISGECRHRGHL
mgnify:CR=1 FL=1